MKLQKALPTALFALSLCLPLQAGQPLSGPTLKIPGPTPSQVMIQARIYSVPVAVMPKEMTTQEQYKDFFVNPPAVVDLLSAPQVVTVSGQEAQIEVVREIIYPTTFTGGVTQDDPPVPGGFETREAGVRFHVLPVVTAGAKPYIQLAGIVDITQLIGWKDMLNPNRLIPTIGSASSAKRLELMTRRMELLMKDEPLAKELGNEDPKRMAISSEVKRLDALIRKLDGVEVRHPAKSLVPDPKQTPGIALLQPLFWSYNFNTTAMLEPGRGIYLASEKSEEHDKYFVVHLAATLVHPGGYKVGQVERKLATLKIPLVTFAEAPLAKVVEALNQEGKKVDPDAPLIQLVAKSDARITLHLKDVTLRDLLRYVTKIADLTYRVSGTTVNIVEMKP